MQGDSEVAGKANVLIFPGTPVSSVVLAEQGLLYGVRDLLAVRDVMTLTDVSLLHRSEHRQQHVQGEA
jgi:hypothetical protein